VSRGLVPESCKAAPESRTDRREAGMGRPEPTGRGAQPPEKPKARNLTALRVILRHTPGPAPGCPSKRPLGRGASGSGSRRRLDRAVLQRRDSVQGAL